MFVDFVENGFRYEIIGNDAVLKGLDSINTPNLKKKLIVPSYIQNKTVVGIQRRAFCGLSIKEIQLPTTISFIAEFAFAGSDLERIEFVSTHNTLTTNISETINIGEKAFENCHKLKLFMTNQKIIAGYMSFAGCTALDTNAAVINIEEMHAKSFAFCRNATVLNLMDNCLLKQDCFKDSHINKLYVDNFINFESDVLKDFLEKEITLVALWVLQFLIMHT